MLAIVSGRKYPPGPANYNAWCGFTWRHAYGQLTDPLRFVTQIAEEYGDLAFYRLFIYRAYQVNHPDLVREVLVTKAAAFGKQGRQRGLIQQVAGAGILTTDGDAWVRKRRMLLPAFQARIVQRLALAAVEEAHRLTSAWHDQSEINLYHSMTDLMIRAVGFSFFGIDTPDEATQLAEALHTLGNSLLDRDYFMFRLSGWVPSLKERQRREAEQVLEDYFDRAIASRRGHVGEQGDLLDLLLSAIDTEGDGRGLTESEVRNEARTMFFAGHHTSAACLTWTLYLLAKHPAVRARLLREVDGVLRGMPPTLADIPRLPYGTQVLQESMRLYPPAWALFAREAIEDVQIGNYMLPKGAWVFIYPWVLHRDARFFPDPLTFQPERFSAERLEETPVGAYIPFGLGGHCCIGGRVALAALQVALPALLQRFTLELPEGSPVPQLHTSISLRPQQDIRMVARARHAAPECMPSLATSPSLPRRSTG
jgi:cytochrome P450